ncbi:MAG: peptidoglycan editing factor PgeF [Ignavibacteriae bacterium]|nr:peptidoglycan editing factor PgeF [Ignavibacteriota bacterium]
MDDVTILRSEMLAKFPEIVFGMSTRRGGVSPASLGMNLSFSVGDDEENVVRNRELFFSRLGIRLNELAIPRQIHSATLHCVERPGAVSDCDGLLTASRRVFLCVSVADCVPVLLYDTRQRVIAGIHAGWRGTSAFIAQRGVEMLVSEFASNPSDVHAFVGPSASSCCYSVGNEVADAFDPRFVEKRNGSTYVNLKQANFDQLVRAGVPNQNIETSPLCTISERELLHSYRRDKERSGRMMAVIGLR